MFLRRSEREALFDRHARDVFNFCLRATGSREVAATATKAAFLEVGRADEAPVGLLAAARRRCAELVEAAAGHEAAAQSHLPVGEANGRLEVRYREVLALRELVGCSYGEIGRIVGADRGGVAELLWRARLELHDELNGSRLTSIAPVADSCRRALALIVMDWDGELRDGDARDALRSHLRTCGKCRVSQKAAREASATYRAWHPAALPLGMRESLLATDSAERPAAGSETSSRRPPGSPPRDAPRGARRSPG